MASTEPENQARENVREGGGGRPFRAVKAISFVFVVLILLFIAADRFGDITFSSAGDRVRALISGGRRGEGYPYHFGNLQVLDVKPLESGLLLITDGETIVLDSTARRVSEIQHDYSSLLCAMNSGRALLMEAGGRSYRLLSRTKILYEGETDAKILTGAVGKNGTVALALRGENSLSQLSVYDRRQNEIFNWTCARELVVSADVSDNGKLAAVSVAGADGGELYSKVFLFDFRYEEPVGVFDFEKRLVSGVRFLSGGTLLASGRNVFSVIVDGRERRDEDLSLNTLSAVHTSDADTSIAVLSKYGSASVKLVRAYDRQGVPLFEKELDRAVRSVSCGADFFSALTDRQLLLWDKHGELLGAAEVGSDGLRCFTGRSCTYVWFTDRIECFENLTAKRVAPDAPAGMTQGTESSEKTSKT